MTDADTTTSHGEVHDLRARVSAEVAKVVVGQQDAVDRILVALLCGGHVLLEGVPGTAKTLMANAFARALGLEFRRAQFTPDMLPSDLTGTMTLRDGELAFRPGPVFTQILLADEINRTPPKTQAALLEAMQEGQTTVDGSTRALPMPFLVIATQNPVEQEGTYPLPEAQLDRFMVKVVVGYPSEEDEVGIVHLARRGIQPTTIDDVAVVSTTEIIAAARAETDATRLTDEVGRYIVAVTRATRDLPAVEVGASPRAGVHLAAASQATARLFGRDFVTPDDVAWASSTVLAHRLVLRPEAELERYSPVDAVRTALGAIPVPR